MIDRRDVRTLASLAKVIRSKNAGPFLQTIDLLFRSPLDYQLVKDSGVLTETAIAQAYRIEAHDVRGVYFWDAALAVKITLTREVSAGAVGDHDCYGAQQHAPLLSFAIPAQD
jgi:hypothetical protein